MMCLQSNSDVMMKGISVCARTMMKSVCLKAYAGFSSRSSVCTRKRTCQVAYAQLRSKYVKPGVTTMVLTHCIERWIVYLIPSRNTIGSDVVLTHGIDEGQIYKRRRKSLCMGGKCRGFNEYFTLNYIFIVELCS